jgi:anti-sigma B factor antagonist
VHRITLDRDAGTTFVVASGELDAFVAGDLEAVFVDAGEDPRIVVDLTNVSFMDSTALGVLVRAVRDVDTRGGAVRVVLPRGTARRIFELTTLDRLLPVAESRSDAVMALQAS